VNRPTRLTVVGIILIIMGVLAVINLGIALAVPMVRELAKAQPMALPLQYAITTGSALVMIASGIAVLTRRPWGRWLYAGWTVLTLLIGAFTSPMKLMLIPGTLIFVVICAILFSAKASAWFARPQQAPR
jgi:hypothetical protein